ncbi:MAG: four helix bundle protein [Acidobacteriota bacterium]
MTSRQEALRDRSKNFALRAIRLLEGLPRGAPSPILRSQFLRSATAVAANYRATGRARSKKEFASRLGVVVEEADETVFWLELMMEFGASDEIRTLLQEANELLAIFAASHRTVTIGPRHPSAERTPDGPMAR